jgi:galactose mutarotase-like enzyme
MSGMVRLAGGDLAAIISPLGAELQSLSDAAGREYMTDADPAFWTGHAPLLFPIVGGLNGDSYRLDGQEYPLPRHGFARRSRFELVEAAWDRALLRLTDSDETRAAYPFAFVLEMEFTLQGCTLSMAATVRNPGTGVLPFSFGYHPAFAWPLPGGGEKLAHCIEFERDEPACIRRLNEAGLLAWSETSPVAGRIMALHPSQYDRDAIIWDELASRRLTYRSPDGPALEIAFPELPCLGIWQKPGANFICIEPWAGQADPAGFSGDFRDKPGVMLLPPGESRSFRMDVTVHAG